MMLDLKDRIDYNNKLPIGVTYSEEIIKLPNGISFVKSTYFIKESSFNNGAVEFTSTVLFILFWANLKR